MARARRYEGEGIVVGFDARLCIHSEECVRNLPSVFDADRRPWIDPSGATADRIAAVVHRCPTGALTYERTDGGPPEPTGRETPMITAVEDGPLHVRGALEVVDHEGRPVPVGPRAALCRCGASANKPFCDNSHVRIGFEAPA